MMEEEYNKLRVLELYSGIGGMHWALKESGVPFEIVMAVDINTTANHIYQHNFPEVNLNSFGIEKLTLKTWRCLNPNAILMSPPCQPFSRVGKKGDCDDVRTKSFLHVMKLLQQVDVKPTYLLVENVKGFEDSRTRQILVDALTACDYGFQEYLLTPLQFGIPNSRLRYYMIAKLRHCHGPSLLQSSEILLTLPHGCLHKSQHKNNLSSSSSSPSSDNNCTGESSQTIPSNSTDCKPNTQQNETTLAGICHDCKSTVTSTTTCDKQNTLTVTTSNGCDRCSTQESKDNESTSNSARQLPTDKHSLCDQSNSKDDGSMSTGTVVEILDAGKNMRFCEESDEFITETSRPLSAFMEEGDESEFESLIVSDKNLRQFVVMDVVLPQVKKSTCFTKRYGHYVEGAGSLVQMSTSVEDTLAASRFKSKVVELKNKHEWGEEELSILRRLKLRYFSPREVANLMGFPQHFAFPSNVSTIQKYRCLGNSLNVHVVARLVHLMTEGIP